ncbi:MAG: tetratricopeptide repeat protein [Planctomycetes bacterium]|nr:tetratricopeptide repeat protein [Planctomycetota bacterium]
MSSPSIPTAAPRPAWIVSAWWDMAYVVVTPLAIVPALLILMRGWLTPEEISLAVIAFASLGHHLPGFMRAYGDRELFLRYRWRFLLCPLVVFALALLFSPPTRIASALELPWQHLHGLELILLFWGTWHGLMQTYGFLRIYDVRMGIHDRWSARLDHWLCLVVFVAGVVFSDARVFGIAQGMWQSGLPFFGPELLHGVRLVVGGVGLCVLMAYLLNFFARTRRGEPVSWLKLLLIGTTGWFYWYTGRLSTNVLIGLAMFEIYHAVQYYAIVWIYNRRLFHRAGERFGPLGFLFRDRWTMLGIYLAAIGAYGSIRYFTVDASEYVFRGSNQEAHQWLMALFVTSSFLHFYFDGFIWKVSERKTQENLVDGNLRSGVAERVVPGLLHSAKWGLLLLIAGGLLYAERMDQGNPRERKVKRLQALAALTPDLPECQALLSRDALSRGDALAAIVHAEKTLALRPHSHFAHADLGLATMLAGQLDKAEEQFRAAIEIEPKHWAFHSNLGMILSRQGKPEEAEKYLQNAIQLRPDFVEPRQHLVDFYFRNQRGQEAKRELDKLAEQFPSSFTAEVYQVLSMSSQGEHEAAARLACYLVAGNENNWRAQYVLGVALNVGGAGELAIGPLQRAKRLRPRSAAVRYQLGLAHVLRGKPGKALGPLGNAIRLDPHHFEAQFQLANTLWVLKKTDTALKSYARCLELRPGHANLCANFGGVLAQLGRTEEAEKIYRQGLAANPDSGRLNYNLGILLWKQGNFDEGREHILRAEKLGIKLSPEIGEATRP